MPVMVEKEKKDKKGKKAGKDKKKDKAGGDEHGGGKPKPKESVEDPDFVHLVRLAGVVVDGNLPLTKALMKIKGVGPRVAESLIPTLGMPVATKVGSLNEEQISFIEKKFEEVNGILPAWMLNRRKDMDSGGDLHQLGPDLDMQKREDINLHKKIKSYRGVRHSLNLPCRGQRTRSSFRTGSTIGVSRKKAKGTGK